MPHSLPRISVIGMGKLGAPMAAVMACAGFEVVGLDTQPTVVAAVNAGKAPVQEPQLQDYINRSQGRLRATSDYRDAILNSDVSFLILPTPSGEDMTFRNDYLLTAIAAIGEALKDKTSYHLVVITSTTMPGSTDGVIREVLEKHTGRNIGERLGLCYNPEFIALGSVIRDMTHPDFILIGESDKQAGDLLESIHQQYLPAGTPIRRMSSVNAELAKIAINTFVTTKISYANMLAALCEQLPGADVDVVTRAVGSDSRIGGKYLKGALGYGGPCFPRDNKAFYALGEQLGVRCDLARATDQINDHQIERLVNTISQHAPPHSSVTILGLSYKPDTGVIDASQGLELATELHRAGFKVTVYDPMANALARNVLSADITIADDLKTAARSSTTLIITTPWAEFKQLHTLITGYHKPRTLIDPWRVLESSQLPVSMQLVQMGRAMLTSPVEDAVTAAQ